MISLQEAESIHETKERVLSPCPTLRNFPGEKPIALLAFLANLRYTSDHYGECERKAVRVIAYFLRHGP